MKSEGLISNMVGAAIAVGERLVNDTAIHAFIRQGGQELGNAFDLSRDGSVSLGRQEYGAIFTATPGEVTIDRANESKQGMVEQAQDVGRELTRDGINPHGPEQEPGMEM